MNTDGMVVFMRGLCRVKKHVFILKNILFYDCVSMSTFKALHHRRWVIVKSFVGSMRLLYVKNSVVLSYAKWGLDATVELDCMQNC